MSTVAERVRGRVDVSLPTLGLAVGDLAAIGLFVVLGEISHGIDPLGSPGVVADTYAPFVIGWLLVAVPAGAYAAAVRTSPGRAAITVAGAWLVADVVAQALRSTAYFHGNGALTFAIVAFLVGGTLLVGWRVAVAFLSSRRQSRTLG